MISSEDEEREDRERRSGPPARVRKLLCLGCLHLVESGSFHCPSCFQYGTQCEPDRDVLRDLEIWEGLSDGIEERLLQQENEGAS